MVMGISEYLKGKSGKPFFLVQGGAGTGKSFSINRALLGIDPKHVIAAAQVTLPKCAPRFPRT
jgi:hypothetical protein